MSSRHCQDSLVRVISARVVSNRTTMKDKMPVRTIPIIAQCVYKRDVRTSRRPSVEDIVQVFLAVLASVFFTVKRAYKTTCRARTMVNQQTSNMSVCAHSTASVQNVKSC